MLPRRGDAIGIWSAVSRQQTGVAVDDGGDTDDDDEYRHRGECKAAVAGGLLEDGQSSLLTTVAG